MKKALLFFTNQHFKLALVCLLCLSQLVFAQKPQPAQSFEISLEQDERIDTEIKGNERVNKATGQPYALFGLNVEVPAGTPESMAMFYIQQEGRKLGLTPNDISNLQHHATRSTNAGSVVRYRQYSGSFPINKAEIAVTISPQNKVVYVMSSIEPEVNLNGVQPTVETERAFELAKAYLNVIGETAYENSHVLIYKNTKITRLAHEVVILSGNPHGEWHVFVDAQTEEIFKVVNEAQYYKDCDHKDPPTKKTSFMATVDGTGMVFDPDPLSSNTVAYGATGYVDGNDASTSQLDAARFNVTLNDITETGGVYSLVGPRAQIVDFDAPFKGMFTQNSPDFIFNRTADAFEAVSCYYHIDFMMDYINNTLGCDIMPYQYAGGVKFDPHGSNGADNSFYTGGTGQLSFGEGGVDDGEDSDVVHHELGHGLHDWVTNGGLSQVDGLSEGCGDYVAQSYNRSLGYWDPADPAYNYVFNWDGHNPFWNGRSTNHFPGYPGGLVGQIHADGQIWASCLMTVWNEIGQQRMDKIFYEGLGMTGGNSSQNDAANAVYQAALNLNYTTQEIIDIHTNLTACGYTLPALPGPPIAAIDADNSTICLDDNNTVNFMDATSPLATTWSWSFEGGTPATSDVQNPSITYAAAGSYDVTLTVTNDEGSDSMTFTDYVTVLQGDDCPSCNTTTNNTPVTITTTGGVEYISVVNITEDLEITDVNVTVDITHTWNNDLIISIVSPEGTEVELSNRNGNSDDDDYTNTVFDQEASTSITDGTSPFTGTFIPEGDLSNIYGEMSAGDWTLKIFDAAAQDGGQLNTWSLELCLAPQLSIEENTFDAFSLYPNPNDGSFTIKLSSFSNQDINVGIYDIRGRSIYSNTFESTTDFEQPIRLNTLQSGMYLVKIEDGDRRAIKKILIK